MTTLDDPPDHAGADHEGEAFPEERYVPDPGPEGEDLIPPDIDPNARRIPAGQVLLVMIGALVLGALFNADRMVERAHEKSLDDDFRNESIWIWSRFQDVSELIRLDLPRERIETAIGREEIAEEDRVTFGQTDGEGEVADPEDPESEGEPEATTTTVPADLTPVVRTPTAAEPLRLWVGGDSMTQTFGSSFQRATASTGIIQSTVDARVSTGLTRPDFFDWPTHLATNVLPTDPEVMVIMFGANDSQGLVREDGTVCKRFEQCWLDDYRLRVAGTMDLLRDEDNDRMVIWVGQPVMGPGTVFGIDKLNAIYFEEAASRPWIRYFDTFPFFATPEGEYADYLPNLSGTEQGMRQADDVHFSTEGGDRLSWEVLQMLEADEIVDLSAWAGDPPPSALAPDEVTERESLPAPTVEIID
jgi:hypothetical protein